jgi:hypothetical protein
MFNQVGQTMAQMGKSVQGQQLRPKMEVPIFCGETSKYLAWRRYMEIMVLDSGYDKPSQFILLMGALSGKAKDLAAHIAPDEEAVDTLLDLLDTRYNDPRILSRDLIDSIISAPDVKADNFDSLDKYPTLLDSTVKALRRHGLIQDTKSTRFLDQITEKLPLSLRRAWHRQMLERDKTNSSSAYEEDSLGNLVTFLKTEARLLQRCQTRPKAKDGGEFGKPQRQVGLVSTSSDKDPKSKSEGPKKGKTDKSQNVRSCEFCKDPKHPIWKCCTFLSLKSEDRKRKVAEKKLCFTCFGRLH